MPSLWATAPENLLIPKGQTMHTPAPWKIEDGESRRVYLINDSKGHAIGEIVYSDTRTRSDAQLIAAAPEMFKALDMLAASVYTEGSDFYPDCSFNAAMQLVFNALKKAEGKTE